MRLTRFDGVSGFDFVTDDDDRFSVYCYQDRVQVEIHSVDAVHEILSRPPKRTSYFIDLAPEEWEYLLEALAGINKK